MLEFSDNVEQAEIKVNVVALPLDPATPCLRVGQSINALIPPLQLVTRTRHDEDHEASTVGVDAMDDGFPTSVKRNFFFFFFLYLLFGQ